MNAPINTVINSLPSSFISDGAPVLLPTDELTVLVDPTQSLELAEFDFQAQMAAAWAICDQCDLQTDIWRGRILGLVRDREKQQGDSRGTGFLKWLQEHELSKSQAYRWLELAASADTLMAAGHLDPSTLQQFSKRAFVETAQAPPEVQQMISDAAQQGQSITRREVRQLHDEWTAMTSEVLPESVREQAANHTIPTRFIAPLVRELEKLPLIHQEAIQAEINDQADSDTLKQLTASARQLNRFLTTAPQLPQTQAVDMEQALAEAVRLGCLNITADFISQATLLEQTLTRLYITWRRLGSLAEQVYDNTGASTPHLRQLLSVLEHLTFNQIDVPLENHQQRIRLTISEEPIE